MSLLDDVSIVVTPNGYKAGELYAVVPVPTEGTEEIVNGDFASDLTGWSDYGTASATGGVATIGASANSGIFQNNILTNGLQYEVIVNVTSYNGVGTAQLANQNGNNIYTITETGIQTFTYTHNIALGQIILRGMSNALFSVSSVSVKEYTAADMDVTRATAATRVDEAGLVNYAEIVGSEEVVNGDFATNLDSWTTSSWWVWNALGAYHAPTPSHKPLYQQSCVIGKTYKITFDLNCVGSSLAKFSLGSSTGSTTQVIGTSLPSGSYSYIVTAAAEYIVFNRQNVAEYYLDNVSVKEVTRDNVPRIDYTGGGCPHILAEPQRTNLITYSEDFENSYYDENNGVTATNNSTTSPSGLVNASKILGSLNNAYIGRLQAYTTTSKTVTTSVFLKQDSISDVGLYYTGNLGDGANDNLQIDLNLGTLTSIGSGITASITPFSNGWYKVTSTYTTKASGSTLGIRLYSLSAGSFFAWGWQLEEGSYATSYIPTSGSTVTRNQDIFTRDGIGSLINSEEGVLFLEVAALSDDLTTRGIAISDGGSSDRVDIYYGGASNRIRSEIRSGGSTQANLIVTSYTIVNFNKIAVKWKENDFAMWINGVEVANDSSGIAPVGMNKLSFDNGSSGNKFFGKVKQLQVYKTALTDEQLLQLTGESGTDFYESYAEMASALTYTIQ